MHSIIYTDIQVCFEMMKYPSDWRKTTTPCCVVDSENGTPMKSRLMQPIGFSLIERTKAMFEQVFRGLLL